MKRVYSFTSLLIVLIGSIAIFVSALPISFPEQLFKANANAFEKNEHETDKVVANPAQDLNANIIFFSFTSENPDVSSFYQEYQDNSYNLITNEYINRVSNGAINYNEEVVLSSDDSPLLLKVASTTSRDDLFNSLITALSNATLAKELSNGGDQITFVYLNYMNYTNQGEADLSQLLNTFNTRLKANSGITNPSYNFLQSGGVSTPKAYTYKTGTTASIGGSIDEYIILHSDIYTLSRHSEQSLSNIAKTMYATKVLNMFGISDVKYNKTGTSATNYTGAWDIMSAGSYLTAPSPYLLYKLGWLPAENIQTLTHTGSYTIDKSFNTTYVIESKSFPNQVIVIYYQEVTPEMKDLGLNAESGLIVSRVSLEKIGEDLPYTQANETYAPVYIFSPQDTGSNRINDDKLLTASLQQGENIGSNTTQSISSIFTNFISLKNSEGLFENTTLTINVTSEDSSSISFNIDCANEDILAQENAPIKQTLGELNLKDKAMRIYLYNVYATKNGLDPFNYEVENTPDENWNTFVSLPTREQTYNAIFSTDSSFRELTIMDLTGYPITDLSVFSNVWFENLLELSISNTNLSENGSQLNHLGSLLKLSVLELVNCNLTDIAELSFLSNHLTKLNLMSNKISDFSVLKQLTLLSYANIMLNQAPASHLAEASGSSSIYASSVVDVGLQCLPTETFTTSKGSYYFKGKISGSNIVEDYTQIFKLNGLEILPSSINEPNIQLKDFEHGVYEVTEISYNTLLSTNELRTLTGRSFYCYYMDFTYKTEEVCQTPLDAGGEHHSLAYDLSIGAYDNLNPMLNYVASDFVGEPNIVITCKDKPELPSDSIDLKNDGEYEIIYNFNFSQDMIDTYQIPTNTLTIIKNLIVYPYDLIPFDDSESPINPNCIKDSNLYKSLLILAGKIDYSTVIPEGELGTGNYALYSQDIYFYGITEKNVPVVSSSLGQLKDLDITYTLSRLGKNATISTLSGIEYLNLKGINNLTINKLGLDNISMLFNADLLPNIKVLNAGGNKISNIQNIESLITLEYVDLSYNQITDPTPLKDLTDENILKGRGLTKQTLQLVNLAFNQISIKGNDRQNEDGTTPYKGGNANNNFLIDKTTPTDNVNFKSAYDTYIVIVQFLQNYDHYANSSKWEYYYTNALNLSSTQKLYTVKINSSTVDFSSKDTYTNWTNTNSRPNSGYFVITMELNSRAVSSGIPFKNIDQNMYYTVSQVTKPALDIIYKNIYPTNPVLKDKNSIGQTTSDYYFLSTEWQKMESDNGAPLRASNDDLSISFPNQAVKDEYIAVASVTYGTITNGLITFEYNIKFYAFDRDTGTMVGQKKLIDCYQFKIFSHIEMNHEISFKDKNLESALLKAKGFDSDKIYAYDFYSAVELNLSNSNISNFETTDGGNGFDKMIFNNLAVLNLSNNKIENNQELGDGSSITISDPMRNLLINPTLFTNLQRLDLSYNSITYLRPFEQSNVFNKDIELILFANELDLGENYNITLVKSSAFRNYDARIILGIQGLNSTNETLVSFKKDIKSSNDTLAKFYILSGNIDLAIDFTYDGIKYETYTGDTGETLWTIYYLTEAKDYNINCKINAYNINFTCRIKHQKIYINQNEAENIDDHKVYCEFDSTDNAQTKQEVLLKDIFTYENCSANDFTYTYTLRKILETDVELKLNDLTTESNYYVQQYNYSHIHTNMIDTTFYKEIYIIDTTAPEIRMTQEDSQTTYVITKGMNYPYYNSGFIDADLIAYDDYNTSKNIDTIVTVVIKKDGVVQSTVEGSWKAEVSDYSINTYNPGVYEIIYTAKDASGNVSEPFIRTIEIYYQQFGWIKISSSSSQFSAGETYVSATVYKNKDDTLKNDDPTFYWYVDGVFVKTSKKVPELSDETNFKTETTLYVEGSGTHLIEVYIDQTKESFERNNVNNMFSANYKFTEVFVLMDNNVMMYTLIGASVLVLLVIILIVILVIRKKKRSKTRNDYEYTIIKHK